MAVRSKLILVWAALLLVAGVAAAVVHDDGHKIATDARSDAHATSTTGSTATSVAVGTDSASSSDTTSAAPAGSSDTTPDTAATGGSVGPSPTVPTNTARVHPDPGTYTTDNSGTSSFGSVPPKSTYTIELLSNGDTHETGDFDLVLRWTPDAASVVSLKIAMAGKEFDAPAGAPLLFIPFNNAPPQWSWSMTSTDGKTTIQQTASVTGNDSVTVGGTAVPTFVVDSTINISGDITGSVHLTAWIDPVTRLAVKQHIVTHVTLPIVVNSDITSVLESLTPS